MTEMVYGTAPIRVGDPILPRWWRTVDRWSLACVIGLFAIGLLLGLAASVPLAEKNNLPTFYYVTRQAVFGGVALLLACLGIYGVTAHAVARRTREIGIRMAVGASRPRVLLTILRGAVWQLAVGVVIGLPAAFFAARLLETTLYGVSTRDPLVLGAGLALLTLAVLAAALIPARRAARMDPVRALRVE